jgi:hypothetical protein
MFSRKSKLHAVPAPTARPDDSARRDPALAAADFRDELIRLIDQAQAHVSFHLMVDMIEQQLTRLRTHRAVTQPWTA